MGATNQIKETNITLELADLTCDQCSQLFTETDIQERNFDLWFDTTNEVNLVPLSEVKVTNLYFPNRVREGYHFFIWIRSIEHQNCPQKDYD